MKVYFDQATVSSGAISRHSAIRVEVDVPTAVLLKGESDESPRSFAASMAQGKGTAFRGIPYGASMNGLANCKVTGARRDER